MKTDRDRPTLTATDLSKRRWPFAVRWSFAVVAGFAVFRCFLLPFVLCRSRFVVRGSSCAVCRLPFAACCMPCRVPCAVRRLPGLCRCRRLRMFSLFFAVFAVFFCRSSFAVLRSPFALGSLILRDVGNEHATQHPDFADAAIPVKLWTAQSDSRHNGLCIAYLLDFIYLELVSVLKYFSEALSCVNFFTKFVDGVCSVNVDCTHDSGFLDDVTRL